MRPPEFIATMTMMAFGFALASASKSASEAAGNDGLATSSSSKRPVSATGAKSRAGS